MFRRYKTGFLPPTDYVFEDLSKADSESSTYSSQSNLNSNHLTQKGTIGANKLKKRAGIFGIFSSNKVVYQIRATMVYSHLHLFP